MTYNLGGNEIFLMKYTSLGTLLWTIELGTASSDTANGAAVSMDGFVYLTGNTAASFNNQLWAGGSDIFLMKLDSTGSVLWTKQIGSTGLDSSFVVTFDNNGN